MEPVSPPQTLERLIEVTDDLHHERGDREALVIERQRLLELAKNLGLIPHSKHSNNSISSVRK